MAEQSEPLLPGMYQEFSVRPGRFGLRGGQIRGGRDKVIHNGGWYNAQSQKLGYGDLATLDIARIARELEGPELFTVLDEHNSYQRYVKKASHLGGLAVVDETLLEGVRAEDQSALGIKDETSEVFPERTFVTFNAEFTVIK